MLDDILLMSISHNINDAPMMVIIYHWTTRRSSAQRDVY